LADRPASKAPTASKAALVLSRRRKYRAGVTTPFDSGLPGGAMLTSRSRSGSGYGMALNNTGLVKLKIRMLRPIPKASDARAMAVNPGVSRRRRRANPS